MQEDDDLPALKATTPEERKRAFGVLFVCLLSLGMGQSLFFAVLPPIARELGMSEFETTMIFSLSALLCWLLVSAQTISHLGRSDSASGCSLYHCLCRL